ncbi:dihydrodipicolinate reductase [Loktanella sp. Alg231-35]|uniref:dihydrodipicolinate reductase n=1 Tax=Loktanella sp. Alg231-35 TaxID=1922220 RepID=UPI000D54F0F8|nr:dihydrodipicolinate reductase [Loktanella sp. Alg231-35]
MKHAILSLALIGVAAPAAADGYAPVKDEQTFVSLIQGKELRNFFYGVRLNVRENGQIDGSAVGWDIAGTWSWEDGFFCREMSWGGDPIPYNCQLVEAQGNERLRFTVDRGAGDSAFFRLR